MFEYGEKIKMHPTNLEKIKSQSELSEYTGRSLTANPNAGSTQREAVSQQVVIIPFSQRKVQTEVRKWSWYRGERGHLPEWT